MIQSILLFALGFLCAGLLALMIAPAVWRRAVRLTRKRVEASAPLTLAEIQAEKDRIRAEFAMSTRRLEMSAKSFREKAAAQIIEINRNREELKSLAQQRMEETRMVAELNRKAGGLDSELRRKEDQLQRLADKLAAAERVAQEREAELEKLGGLYDEASFSSSSRQIELVARESEIDRLRGDIETYRERYEEAEARWRAVSEENIAKVAAIEAERKRAAELEAKIGAMPASSADAGDEGEKPAAGTASDRELFEKRLTLLTRENRRLKEELAAAQGSHGGVAAGEPRQSAALREQMSELAAQVVALTAMIEGVDSPIGKALATPHGEPVNDSGGVISLADRVRALQKAVAAG